MVAVSAVREMRRKMKWKRWEQGMRRHCYIGLSPPFCIQGIFGNRSSDLRRSDFSDVIYGPLPRLLRNRSPCRPFIAAISCYSPKNHRLLRHLLRLSNRYCTAVTPIFSPRFDCSGISACSSGTSCLLDWSFITPLVLTLAPHDHVIYCQARGLSGHTSPCGECALFSSRCFARGLAACSAGFLLSDPGTT